MDRASAILEIKAYDAERRVFSGIATTPTPDRLGDVIDPLGVKFQNPIPLLLHHDKTAPVGTVTLHEPTAAGITFEASIPEVLDAGNVRTRVDEAWHSIKAGLLRGVSIGFRPALDAIKRLKGGGNYFGACEVCELSLVTVPANAAATITMIRSLAATGPNAPGDSGSLPIVRAVKAAPAMNQTTTEQITAFENTRAAKNARMVALMEKAAAEHVTLDETETTEYDGLTAEIKSIDAHLKRLADLESLQIKAAKPVIAPEIRASVPVIQVKSQLPKGTAFTRYAMALAAARGERYQAIEIAKRWDDSTPEVALALKAAVAPGNTTDATWAGPLVPAVQNIANEFIELLRPATIIGRIPGLRHVPFNVSVPMQTAGGTYGWVGQGLAKPVTKLGFGTATLGFAKAAGIIVITDELAKFSSPSAEAIVQADMIAGIAQFLDKQFIDETVAPVANVHPGSITNAIVPLTPTAPGAATTPISLFISDLNTLINAMLTAGISLNGACVLVSTSNAFGVALGRQQSEQVPGGYPSITAEGGSFAGLSIIASEAVGSRVILVSAPYILLADDGGVTLDVSKDATVQMDNAPMNPADATTVFTSLWQNNLIGLRAERYINWVRTLPGAVQWMTGVSYHTNSIAPQSGRAAGPGARA